MRSSIAFVVSCALIEAFAAGPARAEEDPLAPARARTAELAAGLKDYDAALAGKWWFALAKPDGSPAGCAMAEISKAPEGSGAAYRFMFELRFPEGPATLLLRLESLLDAAMVVVRRTSTMVEGDRKDTKVTRRTDAGYICEWHPGWDPRESAAPPSAPKAALAFKRAIDDRHDPGSMWLLALKIDGSKPGEYLIEGIHKDQIRFEDKRELGEEDVRKILVSATQGVKKSLAGRDVEGTEVVYKRATGESFFKFYAGPARRVTAFESADGLFGLPASGEEEATAALEKARSDSAAPQKPEADNPAASDEWTKRTIKTYKDYFILCLDALKKSADVKNEEFMAKAAKANGFDSWADFAVKCVKALGPEGFKKATDEALAWWQAEVTKWAEEQKGGK